MKKLLLILALLVTWSGAAVADDIYFLHNTNTLPDGSLFLDGVPLGNGGAFPEFAENASPFERGNVITTGFPGWWTAVRYYKPAGVTGVVTGRIWDYTSHALLATATFSSETASGWQTQVLPTPIKAVVGTKYVVSYSASATRLINYGSSIAFGDMAPLPLVSPAHFVPPGFINGTSGAVGTFPATPGGSTPGTPSGGFDFYVDAVLRPCFCVNPTVSLHNSTDVPTTTLANASILERGNRINTPAGTITAVKYYKASGATGTVTARIWKDGVQIAFTVFSGESASGWQTQALTTPILVPSGQIIVSYSVSSTRNIMYNTVLPAPSAPLSMPANVNAVCIPGPPPNGSCPIGQVLSVPLYNGIYGAAGTLPVTSSANNDYFVDIVFQ